MPEEMQVIAKTVVWWGFGLGFIFGFFANKTNFCTMGAVSDVVNMGDWGRMRAWLLTIAVAILGTNILAYTGKINLANTIYTGQNLPWLAHIVGGLVFGIGMTLASGCGNKTLVRVGGGNLKAVVVFIYMAYSANVTLRGIFAVPRVEWLQAPGVTVNLPTHQTLPHLLHGSLGLDLASAELVIALVLSGLLMAFVLFSKSFWENRDNFIAGIVLGGVVVAGWYVTGKLGWAENPETLTEMAIGTNSKLAESMSFIAPSGYTLELWSLVDRQEHGRYLGHRDRVRRRRRVLPLCRGDQGLPLGALCFVAGHVPPHYRRCNDGLRRRHRHGLYGRPGDYRLFHALGGRDAHLCRNRRRLGGYHEV
jgi:uncharacterized membrane protein YedE/YeeE